MVKILDISVGLHSQLPTWLGGLNFQLESTKTVDQHGVNVSKMASSVHVGTHVDAPLILLMVVLLSNNYH